MICGKRMNDTKLEGVDNIGVQKETDFENVRFIDPPYVLYFLSFSWLHGLNALSSAL
jgi:hypothetical protein